MKKVREALTTVQKHSREGYNLAALLFLFLFLDGDLLRRVEGQGLEGVLAVFGEIRGGGPVWDVESGGTACILVAGLSAASIKSTPET